MNPAPLLAVPGATPPAKGKRAPSALPQEGTPDFTAALATLLSGNGAGMAHVQVGAGPGSPAPSSGATGTEADRFASGSLAAVLAAAPASVLVSGAAAPQLAGAGGAATGAPVPARLPQAGAASASGFTVSPVVPTAPASSASSASSVSSVSSVSSASSTAPASAIAGPGGPEGAHRGTPAERTDGDTQPGTGHTDPAPSQDPATMVSSLASLAPQATATTTVTSDADVTTTVLRQVFPEVTQVATTPGTHRISITLHPESLGEVKVTVVVRPGGGVHVRLAADAAAPDAAQARQALLQGAPELHRLLEGAASSVKVVVQGQTAASASSASGQSGQSATDARSQNSAQQSQSQAQSQAQAQSQTGDGQRRSPYAPGNPQNLPQGADLPIGATTTATTRNAARPGRVHEHAGRLDRLM